MEWTQVLTILGGNMAIFLWAVRQSRTDFLHMCKINESIKDEMKEFHGRLEKQDAEFKGRIEKQDAEFKAHIMYQHKK